ncbi:hypothetical protein PR048_007740 [Dryococelus australis]|uniref:PiggyBac transposable element-derived protein domain-containing protein n=1 Tax=Dryococelus australis TaxID=614101 RepID=A0ABQ9HV41_9NEOP|nr:hypothetical protein PR048_007740 [Dryococelus australis]
MYWQTQPDVHVSIVAEAVRRNRFDEIIRYLHIADNSAMDGIDLSIDESIIPYFGHHSAKQFIRGKPIRFGFKMWIAADPSRYIFHVEPYCGTSTRFPTTGNGQGNDVVMGLEDHLQLKKGTILYFDNFFTSVSLLRNL